MDRVRLPRLPKLDGADRRILTMGLILALLVTLVLVWGAAVVGLALRVFWLAAGL